MYAVVLTDKLTPLQILLHVNSKLLSSKSVQLFLLGPFGLCRVALEISARSRCHLSTVDCRLETWASSNTVNLAILTLLWRRHLATTDRMALVI